MTTKYVKTNETNYKKWNQFWQKNIWTKLFKLTVTNKFPSNFAIDASVIPASSDETA